jgi:hypothetical protein
VLLDMSFDQAESLARVLRCQLWNFISTSVYLTSGDHFFVVYVSLTNSLAHHLI